MLFIICRRAVANGRETVETITGGDGQPVTFPTKEGCRAEVTRLNAQQGNAATSFHVGHYVPRFQPVVIQGGLAEAQSG